MCNVTPVVPMNGDRGNATLDTIEQEATISLDRVDTRCTWNVHTARRSHTVEARGVCYEYSLGTWIKT